MARGGHEVAAALAALSVYVTSVLPDIRSRQREWVVRAAQIPDPVLREKALGSLRDKARNVEATAVFATLAPRRHRPAVIGAGAALQIAIDYLDSLGEEEVDDPLADGLRLHGALAGIVEPGVEADDPYRFHPHGEDGGYLAALVRAGARAAASLPRLSACAPLLRAAIGRCGEGQAYTHAAPLDGSATLRSWAESIPAPIAYEWWETAAGASSSVDAHALLALAADPGPGPDAPRLIDAAYFPSIGALTVLLDDLVDLDEDVAMGQHNYIAYYKDDRETAARLGLLADRANLAIEPLPRRRRHAAILAGVAGFYLGDPVAGGERARPVRDRLLESLGAPTRILAAFSRLRNRA